MTEYLDKLKFLDHISKIPDLTNTKLTKNPTLVKFHYMAQNIIENQLYVSVAHDKNNNIVLSKYCEVEYNSNLEEEDLNDDYSGSILLERLIINAVPIPAMTQWLKDSLGIGNELDKKKVLVYDYDNDNLKVNEERTAIGLAYCLENVIIIDSIYNLKDMVSHCYKSIDAELTRQSIYNTLIAITNDNLLAEYLILFLTSQILGRVSGLILGKVSLNLRGCDEDMVYMLNTYINNIVHYAINIDVNIQNLNKSQFASRYDPNTDELVQGLLQTVDHTFITLNELKLEQGTLDQNGLKNYETVKNLITFQTFYYDYPYSKVEIFHDNPIIIYSQSKPLFDVDPHLIIVK